MPSPINVRVRGIYSTVLTALLLAQGWTIVDASPAIQEGVDNLLCLISS
jgi:hypothetical protein